LKLLKRDRTFDLLQKLIFKQQIAAHHKLPLGAQTPFLLRQWLKV